jgi:hypothetical protein
MLLSWLLILIHAGYAQLALIGIFGEINFEFVLWFYPPLIGFLGGSTITVMFLGKRRFLPLLALNMGFSSALAIVVAFTKTHPRYIPFAWIFLDLFSSKVISVVYLSMPFLVIVLCDLYSYTGLQYMSRRRWAFLICTIVAALLITAYSIYAIFGL